LYHVVRHRPATSASLERACPAGGPARRRRPAGRRRRGPGEPRPPSPV